MKKCLFIFGLMSAMIMYGCSSAASSTDSESKDPVNESTESNNEVFDAFGQECINQGLNVDVISTDISDEKLEISSGDTDVATVNIWTFSDSNLAITKWNEEQQAVESDGYEIQTQNSSELGSDNIYYNPETEQYAVFVMAPDTSAVYKLTDIPSDMLTTVKSLFKALNLME